MKKRGRGEGTVYRYRGGWAAAVTTGWDPHVRKQTKRYFYGKTQTEVRQKLETWREQPGADAVTEAGTVAEAVDLWLASQEGQVDQKTHTNYALQLRPVSDFLGGREVASLTSREVSEWVARMASAGVTPVNRRFAFLRLKTVLRHQVALGAVPTNPLDALKAPRYLRAEVRPLTATQARTLVASARSLWDAAIIRLALDSGMRAGELMALAWEDVTLRDGGGEVFVRYTVQYLKGEIRRKTVKTKASRRRIPVTAATSQALRALHDLYPAARAVFHAPMSACAVTPEGFAAPYALREWWKQVGRRAGLPGTKFHDLRHTCASLLLQANVHPKVVQERLGHASIVITLDTYSHLLPTAQEAAVTALEGVFGPPVAVQ